MKGESMINKVMTALTNKDFKGLAECFSKDCRYFDYCPSLGGKENYFVYGKEAVEMFFRNKFVHRHFEASSAVVENESCASFFGSYDAPFVYAGVRIEAFDDDGLIEKLVVSPA